MKFNKYIIAGVIITIIQLIFCFLFFKIFIGAYYLPVGEIITLFIISFPLFLMITLSKSVLGPVIFALLIEFQLSNIIVLLSWIILIFINTIFWSIIFYFFAIPERIRLYRKNIIKHGKK